MRPTQAPKWIFALGVVVLFAWSGCDSTPQQLPPVAPLLVAPLDGLSNAENAVFLEWTLTVEAELYELELATDPTFSSPLVHDSHVVDSNYAVNQLDLGTTYFWRVRASNENGVSEWSDIWAFTPSRIAEPPAAPRLLSPLTGRTGMPREVNLEWDAVPGAFSYHLQVSVEPNFWRNEVDLENLRDLKKDVTGLIFGYTYYWRVRASNAAGYSEWTRTWDFIVITG